jgi:hypothetical protein
LSDDAGGDPAWEQFGNDPSAAQTSGFSFFEDLERETAELEGKGKQRASSQEDRQADHGVSGGYNFDAFEPAWTASNIASQSTLASAHPLSSAEEDGHAVISLLSDPSFNPLSSISDADDLAALQDQPNPYIPTPTSNNQQGNETISLLSLVPGIDYYLSSTAPTTTTETEPSQRVAIVRTTPTSISISVSSLATTDRPWASVDNLYHDVVYGNLREEPVDWDHDPAAEPLREMVAEHVRECEERAAPLNDPVALRRLQMLLRHVGEERKGGNPAAV